jgi:hypothetical protein
VSALGADAWRGYRQDAFPRGCWAVEGEVLHALGGAGRVSLISMQRFGDFDLALEWRLPPGGNSGVLYRVDENAEAPWQSGPEMQLLDNGGHPDGRVPETACGALYGLQPPFDAPPCHPGLWNVARVRVRGTQVEHWLNGRCVVACDLAAAAIRGRIAQSKFRDYPGFARAAEGHVVLQHHGTQAWFRKIRIRFGTAVA